MYDLPSVSSLVHLHHASTGNPVPSTWFAAIKAGNYKTFTGLTLTEPSCKRIEPFVKVEFV
jgi:hypothetical protein